MIDRSKTFKIAIVELTPSHLLRPSLELRGNTLEPYACEVLSTYLQDQEDINNLITVNVIQQETWSKKRLAIELLKHDLVGFSVLTCNYNYALELARFLKLSNNAIITVFGGQHPSLVPLQVARNHAAVDYTVAGPGEFPLAQIVRSALHARSFTIDKPIPSADALSNVFHYDLKMKNVLNGKESGPNVHSFLKSVTRENSRLSKCRNWNLAFPSPHAQTGVAQIQYSRGCPNKCKFCATPIVMGGSVRYRQAGDVVAEIKEIRRKFRAEMGKELNFFYFNDVTFNQDTRRMRQLLDLLIKDNDLATNEESPSEDGFNFFCLCKIGISAEDAMRLRNAGCRKIGFGIESIDTKSRQCMDKSWVTDQGIIDTLRVTDAVGIINRVYLLVGTPWETAESYASIQAWLQKEEHLVDQIRVAFVVPFPGTPASHDPDWKLLEPIDANYDNYSEDFPIVQNVNGLTPDEQLKLRRNLIVTFYNSSAYRKRVDSKLARFPFLRRSYEAFADELAFLSRKSIRLTLP